MAVLNVVLGRLICCEDGGGNCGYGRHGGAHQAVVRRLPVWRARRVRDRPEDWEGTVQRGLSGQGSPQRGDGGPQEGPDIRDDGQQGQARLHEGDTTSTGESTLFYL